MKIILTFLLFFTQLGIKAIATPLALEDRIKIMCSDPEDQECRRQETLRLAAERRQMTQELTSGMLIYPTELWDKEIEKVKWACENFVDIGSKFGGPKPTPIPSDQERERFVRECVADFRWWITSSFASGPYFKTEHGYWLPVSQ